MSTETILITGASSDLAAELIRSIASRGNAACILAHFHHGRERMEKLRSELGDHFEPIQADLSEPSGVEQLIAQVRSRTEFPNKIVHFAGLKLRLERFAQADLTRFDADFQVQVRAAMRLLQEFLPAMARAENRTKVVLVLSSATLGVPAKFMSAYTVVKYAESGLLRALAVEYAGTSVNINGVSPYMVGTQFLSEIPEKAREMAAAATPDKRLATPAEVVAVIEFLLSSGSDYLNGVNLPVTGGTAF
jgi:3-oxoacyl-[acyl-carrier protein] reductase